MPDLNKPLSDEEILVKHVFRGSSFAVVRLEELSEVGNLKADAVSCYRPVNAQELFAVEYIAVCQQRMLRGARLECGLFTTALDYCLEQDGRTFRPMSESMVGHGDIEITRAQNRNFAAGEGVHRMVKETDVWSILLRYQVNAERQYRRAVQDFERLKRMRPEMPNHPNIGTEPDVIEVAPLKEINPLIRLEPEFCSAEPAAESPLEPSNVVPNTPENDAPEDGTPLAPAAASTTKTREPIRRIPGSATPEGSRVKVKPFAPLRRLSPRPTASASKARRAASLLGRTVCRPAAHPAPSHLPATTPAASSNPPEPVPATS
jgi:hypothetical protein